MRHLIVVLLTLFAITGSLQAQLFGEPNTHASLLFESSTVVPGQPLRGAFLLEHDDGWHTYWKNGGDVGLGTEAHWTLPSGWRADPILWPVPQYLETSGLVSYAYEGRTLLPFVLHPPAESAAGDLVEIQVALSWLECDDICIPGEAQLSAQLTVAGESLATPEAPEIEAAFANLPKPAEGVQAFKQGDAYYLTLPNEAGDEVRFFPDSAGQIHDLAPQEMTEIDGRSALRLEPSPTATEPVERLSGVLTWNLDRAFELDLPLEAGAPAAVEPASLQVILWTLLLAFVGGLILNLMPCVFPVLSLKVLSVVEQSREEGDKPWHHGAFFTLGVLVSFWVLSGLLLAVRAAGDEVGWGYHLQNPAMIATLALLFLVIALNLFGVFEVGESLSALSNVAERKEGFSHSFWSGVLTTIAATPCTAPFMGGAVGFALAQPAWVALVIFSGLGLGVAAPYFTLTLFPGLLRRLPRPGPWMVTFKQLLAFPMLLASVWLLWVFGGQADNNRLGLLMVGLTGVAFACWAYGRWGHDFDAKKRRLGQSLATVALAGSLALGYQAARVSTERAEWLPFSPELVSQLRDEGRPVFLDFTADWCTSCKANELVTLSRADVQRRFKELDVALVKADWTKKDPKITAALAEFGRAGVPLYVLYPGPGEEPLLLPEVLLPGSVFEALEKVGPKES